MGQKPDPKSKKPPRPSDSALPTVMDLSEGDWKEVPKKTKTAWDDKVTDPLPKPVTDQEIDSDIAPVIRTGATAGDDSLTVAILAPSELLELEEMSSSSGKNKKRSKWSAYPPGIHQRGGDPSSVILAIDGWLQNKEAIKRLIPEANPDSTRARESTQGTDTTQSHVAPIKGRSLATALKSCRTAKQRLALLPRFAQVCRTIAYAHSRGVVHLGLDENSVLLGERGETVIRNWECAAVLDSGGALPGPPASIALHMSPERIGNAAPPHPTADVWSLGVLLFKILTGRPLFEANGSETLESLILEGEIAHPRQLEPRVPDSLAKLCLRALRRSPGKRLNDAATLARLLERLVAARLLLSPKDITKIPVPTGEKKPKKLLIAGAAALIALSLAVALVMVLNPGEEQPTADKTRMNREAAEHEAAKKAREEALRLLEASLKTSLTQAEHAQKAASLQRYHAASIRAAASLLGNPAYPGSPNFDENFATQTPKARESAASMLGLYHLSRASARYEILDTTDSGSDIALWTTGSHAEAVFVGTAGGVVRRHDIGTWSTPEELGNLSSPIVALSLFPGGDKIVAVSREAGAAIWDTKTGKRKTRLSLGADPVVAASLSFDGSVLATAHPKGGVKLWATERGKPLSDLRSRIGAVGALAYNPQRNRLATGGSSGEIMIWQLPAERRHLLIEAHSEPVQSLVYSADGKRLLSTSNDGTVRIWDTDSGHRLFSVKLGFTEVPVATWVPNRESWLALVSESGSLRIFDWKSDVTLSQLDPPSESVQLIAHSTDGDRMLTKGSDGTVSIWRRSDQSIRHMVVSSNPNDVVNDIAFSKDGSVMAVAASNHVVRVWKNADPRSEISFAIKGEPAVKTAVSSDGRRVAALSESGVLRTFLLDPIELSFKTESHTARDRALAFVPGKEHVAVGGADGSVRYLAAADGELIGRSQPDKKNGAVLDLAFSPDGNMIASLHKNGRLVLRDSATGESVAASKPDTALLHLAGFSPDGKTIAAGSEKGLFLLDTKKAQVSGTVAWTGDEISAATHAAAEGFVAASGKDRVVIWDTESLTPFMNLKMPLPISTIASNPDGRRWVFGLGNTVAVLPFELLPESADPLTLLSRAEQAAGFTLDDLTEAGSKD